MLIEHGIALTGRRLSFSEMADDLVGWIVLSLTILRKGRWGLVLYNVNLEYCSQWSTSYFEDQCLKVKISEKKMIRRLCRDQCLKIYKENNN